MNKEISFIVTEEQENQLLAYAKQIGAESVEYPQIPQWQKDEINKRLEESELDPTQWIDWEDVSINL